MDILQVVKHPDFGGMEQTEQLKVLSTVDANFGALAPEEQTKALTMLLQAPAATTLPGAEAPSPTVPDSTFQDQAKAQQDFGTISQEVPEWKRTISNTARPVLEGGVSTFAAFFGATEGPAAAVLTGGYGYAAGKNMADRLDEFLGITQPASLSEQAVNFGEDLFSGMAFEALGQSAANFTGRAVDFSLEKWRTKTSGGLGLTDKSVKRKVGYKLAEQMDNTGAYADNAQVTSNVRQQIGDDFVPTLGQSTGDPGIMSLERTTLQKPTKQGTQALQNYARSQGAIKGYVGEVFGADERTPVLNAIAAKQQQIDGMVETARKAVDALTDKFSTVSPDATGATIRGQVLAAKEVTRMRAGALYDAVPDAPVKTDKLYDALRAIEKDFDPDIEPIDNFPMFSVKGLKKKIIDSAEDGEIVLKDINFSDLRKIRTTIQDAKRTASAAKNGALERRLIDVQNAVEDAIDTLSDAPGEVGDLYRSASQFYKEQYTTIFKRGAVADMLSKERTGAFKVKNALVATKFFQPSRSRGVGEEVADDFLRAVGNDELARTAMKDAIGYDLLYGATDSAGNITTTKFNAFMKNFEGSLKKLGIYDEISNIGAAQNLVDDAIETKQLFARSAAAKALGSSPEHMVSTLFPGKKDKVAIAKELMETVKGNLPAEEGIKRAVVHHIINSAETNSLLEGATSATGRIDPGALRGKLKDFDSVLKYLYKDEPSKLQAIETVRDAFTVLDRTKAASLSAGPKPVDDVTIATSILAPTVTKSYMLVNSIRSVGRLVGVQIGADFNEMMSMALLDPDVAFNLIQLTKGNMTQSSFVSFMKGHAAATALQQGAGETNFLAPLQPTE